MPIPFLVFGKRMTKSKPGFTKSPRPVVEKPVVRMVNVKNIPVNEIQIIKIEPRIIKIEPKVVKIEQSKIEPKIEIISIKTEPKVEEQVKPVIQELKIEPVQTEVKVEKKRKKKDQISGEING